MKFQPGKTPIPASGRLFDRKEVKAASKVVKSGWWTCDKVTTKFEEAIGNRLGMHYVTFCNSGSSANLLAMHAVAEIVPPGTPVVTTALAFPTTVSAILRAGLRPVFVDVNLSDYNADNVAVREAVSSALKTHERCVVFLTHTLGHPWNLDLMREWDERVIVVEDNCDAFDSEWHGKRTGGFGLLSTLSFFPAHHITTGEGGAVATRDPKLNRIIKSFRDWGRDCWCLPGHDDSCGRRFERQCGSLPAGYDHKYIFSRIGYNLKATDIQAAIGLAQLAKLPSFTKVRRFNWQKLRAELAGLGDELLLPCYSESAAPSWFGFSVGVRSNSFTRLDLIKFLESRRIATRMLFAGNILRQPGYENIPHSVVGTLTNTNWATERAFWVGVWPGLTTSMLDYVVDSFYSFVRGQK